MLALALAAAVLLAGVPGLPAADSGGSPSEAVAASGGGHAELELTAPQVDGEASRSEILRWLRVRLTGGPETELNVSRAPGRYLAMVSLSRSGRTAVVARGDGDGLEAALAAAADRLRTGLGGAAAAAGVLKVDLAVKAGPAARFDAEGRARLDRSLDGLWLVEPDLVLLPEELLSRRLVNSDGDLQSKRLRRYLDEGVRLPAAGFDDNPGRSGAPYRTLRFDSFIEGEGGDALSLYRGNVLDRDTGPPALLRAARDGGLYLLRAQRPDGSFDYSYEPKMDTVSSSYNLLRHAGTCYALVELYQATGDDRFRAAADSGLDFLLTTARGPKPEDQGADFEAIVSPDEEAKLGGAALAVLAMVQYQRATGDDRRLDRMRSLARFLIHQQDVDGHFRSKYFYGPPDPKPFESIYYPGEAILALMRLHAIDPNPLWLATARAGADWLIDVRDAGKATAALPHDHWLLMGLDELHAATGDARYTAHAGRVASAIVAAQRLTSSFPDWVGSFYDPPRSTPTATRAEGLVAASRLARRTGGDEEVLLAALHRMAAFQLRCQLTPHNVLYLPNPERAVGGFRRSLTNWEVRIDYVQHNVSALLGLRSLLDDDAPGSTGAGPR